MKRVIKIIVCACLSQNLVFAQNENIKKSINNIKCDTTYIYGEATLANKDKAFEMAKQLLYINIEVWVKSILPNQDVNSVAAKKIDNYCQQLALMRGNQYRSFVYVNKNDIYAFLPINNIAITLDNRTESGNQTAEAEYKIVNKPSNTTFVNKQNHIPSSPLPNSVTEKYSTYKDLLSDLLKVSTLTDAKVLLDSQEHKNKYHYGSLRSTKDVQFIKENKAILLIFNSSNKNICAIVKLEDSGRSIINLKTGNADSLVNYPDCDVIWIIKSN